MVNHKTHNIISKPWECVQKLWKKIKAIESFQKVSQKCLIEKARKNTSLWSAKIIKKTLHSFIKLPDTKLTSINIFNSYILYDMLSSIISY